MYWKVNGVGETKEWNNKKYIAYLNSDKELFEVRIENNSTKILLLILNSKLFHSFTFVYTYIYTKKNCPSYKKNNFSIWEKFCKIIYVDKTILDS